MGFAVDCGETVMAVPTAQNGSHFGFACEEATVPLKHGMSIVEPEDRTAMVTAFLKKHGYSSVDAPKRTGLKKKYPIHTAAKRGDRHMVQMLLEEGANPARKTSLGTTAAQIAAAQIAAAKDRRGSHATVLRLLGAALGGEAAMRTTPGKEKAHKGLCEGAIGGS